MTDLPLLPYAERVAAVDSERSRRGHDALWLTKLISIRWLTGFTGSHAHVLLTDANVVLVTDSRYTEQAIEETAESGIDVQIMASGGTAGDLLDDVAGRSLRVGFEAANLPVSQLTAAKRTWAAQRLLLPTENIVEDLRKIKDDGEIHRLREASRIADRALTDVISSATTGVSELEFARELEGRMTELGSQRPSFDTIVASGPNSARPHGRPTNRIMAVGDFLVIDFGATVDGYGSDMTRTIVIGGEPTDQQQAWHDAVAEAQALGVQAVRAGAEEKSIDDACRDHLTELGMGDDFGHGTGHSLGLEIHEPPILSPRATGTLQAGMLVTVEPGAYRAGIGGVRVEDTVLVTETGCEPITLFPKGLAPTL